jgi:hypothetical protein
MQVWRNCRILSEQTSDSSTFLSAMYLLKYVLNFEQHFSFFIFWSGLSDIQINRNRISEGLLYLELSYIHFILAVKHNSVISGTDYIA